MLGKYIRLSDQDDDCRPGEKAESNSVINQRLLLDHFIANDPELAGCRALEFLDDGHTGTNFDRPGIQALFAAVRRGEIDCIIVKDSCVIIDQIRKALKKLGFSGLVPSFLTERGQ